MVSQKHFVRPNFVDSILDTTNLPRLTAGVSMNELGSLSQCMTDGDSDGLGEARNIRRKALLASGVFEFSLVAALLVWPLITPGVISNRVVVMPLPPFRGLPQTQETPPRANEAAVPNSIYPHITTDSAPAQRNRRSTSETNAPESPLDASISGIDGPGPVLPGAGSRGPVIIAPPRPPANAARPVQVSSGVMQAALVYRVEPTYPAIAKAIHLEGAVHLRAIIKTDGSVGELTLVDGNPILGIAAEYAVRQWRYKPTLLSGQPVEVETIITVNFVLE
jgi:periplasmic protein TonB